MSSSHVDGPWLAIAYAPLVVMASAKDALAKFGPHMVLTWSAADWYVYAMGCFRFAVAIWYIFIVSLRQPPQVGFVPPGRLEFKGR